MCGFVCFWLVALTVLAQSTTNPAAGTMTAPPTNAVAATDMSADDSTNAESDVSSNNVSAAELKDDRDQLAKAQNLVNTRQMALAEPVLIALLAEKVPDEVRKPAMFLLATAVEGENDLPRAQSILAQYLDRWQGDPRTPEILLRQGQIFRQMGLNNLALGKFYGVMTVALSLRSDQMDYYRSLVLSAQIEIAETHYLMGQFSDAADFYSRLLKQTDTALNRPLAQFRLVRSLQMINRTQEAIGAAQDFLARYPDDPQEPEVRYYLAQALKAGGQNGEALRQVLFFLQEEKSKTKSQPEVWAYWQQRVGNEIANELYKEGDYVKALDVYLSLQKLDPSPAWQIPVQYQVGITYEHLLQPAKALDTYNDILSHEAAIGTNAGPSLQAIFEMAHWRANFLSWQSKAQDATVELSGPSGNSNNANEITSK